jgi:hypothetical protein
MQWWLQIGGRNLNRESVRVRPQKGRPAISGECNVCKDTPQKAKRQKIKTGPPPAYAASTLSMATQNVINIGVVFAVSGTILLGLLAAKHF